MRTTELIREVGEGSGETQRTVENVLYIYADVVLRELKKDRDAKVPLPVLGNFRLAHRAPKRGVKALTGQKEDFWYSPAHDELIFQVAYNLVKF